MSAAVAYNRVATVEAVAQAFATVPLLDSADRVAAACIAAVRELLGGPVCIQVPTSPIPLVLGDLPHGTQRPLSFPCFAAEGRLFAASIPTLPAPVRSALRDQLARVWQVQDAMNSRSAEIDGLRFHVAALQQVSRTLAEVRDAESAERLILDSVGEVFFAWWAALYRRNGDRYERRAIRSLRGDRIAESFPAEALVPLGTLDAIAPVPPPDAAIRTRVAADIEVLMSLDLGEDRSGLLLLGPRMTDTPYSAHDLGLLRALANCSAVALRNSDLLDRLRIQATIDPLTGCCNRRAFAEAAGRETERSISAGGPMSLVLLDLDRFKQINDELGHDAGDRVLRWVGELLRRALPVGGSAFRLGGEEFAVMLPATPKDEGRRVAEALRALIEDESRHEGAPRPLTASFGVASLPGDAECRESLYQAADRALYRAKHAGRNRVVAVGR